MVLGLQSSAFSKRPAPLIFLPRDTVPGHIFRTSALTPLDPPTRPYLPSISMVRGGLAANTCLAQPLDGRVSLIIRSLMICRGMRSSLIASVIRNDVSVRSDRRQRGIRFSLRNATLCSLLINTRGLPRTIVPASYTRRQIELSRCERLRWKEPKLHHVNGDILKCCRDYRLYCLSSTAFVEIR